MIIDGGYKLDYSTLSYTTQKKTYKLQELKGKLDKKRTSLKLPSGVSCLLAFYVFLYNDRYASYATAVFENHSAESAIKRFDLIALIILATTMFILYILFAEFKKLKDSYEELRKDLIKTINNEFCTCKKTCNCKDAYIKDMEGKGIDLIFN
jgi:hypothetical protein